MVNRKGFVRTLEAVIAIALTFTLLTVAIPSYTANKKEFRNEDVLQRLSRDHLFRGCVLNENVTCINQTLAKDLELYNVRINISKSVSHREAGLPKVRTFTESLFISGNGTSYEPRILRIYYWEKK